MHGKVKEKSTDAIGVIARAPAPTFVEKKRAKEADPEQKRLEELKNKNNKMISKAVANLDIEPESEEK